MEDTIERSWDSSATPRRDWSEMGRYFVKLHGPGVFRGIFIRW